MVIAPLSVSWLDPTHLVNLNVSTHYWGTACDGILCGEEKIAAPWFIFQLTTHYSLFCFLQVAFVQTHILV